MTEMLNVPIQGLAPDAWFQDRANSSIWLRLYSSLFVPHSKFFDAVAGLGLPQGDAHQSLEGAKPASFSYGLVRDFTVFATSAEIYSQEAGNLKVDFRVSEHKLAPSSYVLLATPYKVDGAPGDEAAVRAALNELAALITTHTGLNFMHRCVFDGEVSAVDGRMSAAGPIQKMPMWPVEGPFLAKENGVDVMEIATAIRNVQEPKRGRIRLALELMDSAMRKDYGFFEYWTALEVVVDGKGGRIKTILAEIYGLRSHKEASEKVGFQVLNEWRGAYVHKGIRAHLSADIERYIQLLFLDLLRHQLKLPFKGHLAGLLHAPGFDLTPLGLGDNRTATQRAAATP